MATSPLLARITFALSTVSAVSVGLVACGETTDGGVGQSGGNGGSISTGGTGGTSNTGGSNNTGGSGIGGSGTGGACQRPIPADGQACHVTADCAKSGGLSTCFPPGRSSCDGLSGPEQPSCTTDAECAQQSPGWICQPQPYGQKKVCREKCDDANVCGVGLACNAATGGCEPISCATGSCPAETFCNAEKVCQYQSCNTSRPCQEGSSCSPTTFTCAPTTCTGAAGECPALFACDTATKVCARRTCGCDSECPSDGYCIAGSCYATPGHCDGGCAIGRPLTIGEGELLVATLLRGTDWGLRAARGPRRPAAARARRCASVSSVPPCSSFVRACRVLRQGRAGQRQRPGRTAIFAKRTWPSVWRWTGISMTRASS